MDIKQLQDKIGSLELHCFNHSNVDVRHQWAVLADGYMINGHAIWSEVDDEKTLKAAIVDAEQLLSKPSE